MDGQPTSAPAELVRRLLLEPPALAWRDGLQGDQLDHWRSEVKATLRRLLGLPPDALPTMPKPPQLLFKEPRDGYTLEKWLAFPEPGLSLPYLVLTPDAAARAPAPAVLCLPGSQQPKEALCGEPWDEHSDWQNRFGDTNYMALHMVRAGFVALAVDNPFTCEQKTDAVYDVQRQSLHLIWLGRSYEGLSLTQRLQLLDLLADRPDVDRQRLATCGHSLGAKPAMLCGLLDPRVRAVVWNDHASHWREQIAHTKLGPVANWHYIPGFATQFDYMDLICALAPTPFLATEGGRLPSHRILRAAYAASDAPDAITIDFMPNFRDPANRTDGPLPPVITSDEYARYANFDSDHYFKADVVVPWLRRQLA